MAMLVSVGHSDDMDTAEAMEHVLKARAERMGGRKPQAHGGTFVAVLIGKSE